jgi:hypothetical protein
MRTLHPFSFRLRSLFWERDVEGEMNDIDKILLINLYKYLIKYDLSR